MSPASKRKAKSPSPQPTKLKKKARSPSPPLARLKKIARSPSPPPAVLSRPKRTISKQEPAKPDPAKLKKPTPPVKKQEEEEKAPIKIRQLDEAGGGDSTQADTEEEEELVSQKYPKNCKVEAKMHNSWYVKLKKLYFIIFKNLNRDF